MIGLIKNIQHKLLAGFVAFFSTFSVAIIRLESNPQDCEMISTPIKNKKEYTVREKHSL